MPEAARQRPAKHTELHTFAGHIAASPHAVFDLLDARLRPPVGSSLAYLADPTEFLVVVQGSWWYRTEYRLVPHELGSTLEHVILNVAQLGEKAALTAGRRVVANAPLAFHDLVRNLRADVEQGADQP